MVDFQAYTPLNQVDTFLKESVVKNTFLSFGIPRAESGEFHFRPKRFSCPSCPTFVESLDYVYESTNDSIDSPSASVESPSTDSCPAKSLNGSNVSGKEGVDSPYLPQCSRKDWPDMEDDDSCVPRGYLSSTLGEKDISSLISVVQDAQASLPSIGSMNHHHDKTRCMPCRFALLECCNNGKECDFCHLCSMEDFKARTKILKREKKQQKQIERKVSLLTRRLISLLQHR